MQPQLLNLTASNMLTTYYIILACYRNNVTIWYYSIRVRISNSTNKTTDGSTHDDMIHYNNKMLALRILQCHMDLRKRRSRGSGEGTSHVNNIGATLDRDHRESLPRTSAPNLYLLLRPTL